MAVDDLAANLRLLCSYSHSVTDVSRRIGINRQQFTKYLSDRGRPSLQNLRRIADHFGLDDSELLLDHAQFRRLIAIKRPLTQQMTHLSERAREILLLTPESVEHLQALTGFYHNYFCPAEFPGKILRGLVQVFEEGGIVFSRNIERYPGDTHRVTQKYNGLFMHSGERVMMFEREARVGRMLWLTVLYSYDRDQPSLLPGLSVGVTSSSARDVACYRVILQRLGQNIDLRSALGRCGLYDVDDERIDPNIRSRVPNEMRPDEAAFLMRV